MKITIPYLCIFSLLLLFSCNEQIPSIRVNNLFTLLPEQYTRLKFENTLVDETDFNVFKYRNYYNGGGVAIGDVNNDGLPDVYLTANQKSNRLFLNEGDFRFRDVTSKAGVAGSHNWSTGTCLVDINGDGLLDIYVCNSGFIKGDNRANELFINEGNNSDGVPAFREAAAEYGIDDKGFSTHAAFFDYDRDGDLDLYVLNNAFRPLSTFDLSKNLRHERDPTGGGDRLYRNDSSSQNSGREPASKFTDVSEQAGILGSVIAFGLGVSVSDLNNDGWLDIYIANDFFERDYLYINNRDGTFTENLEAMIRYVSLSSMGADIADLNNDGLMDIFGTDMLPEDDYRLKTTFTYDTFDRTEKQIEWGYYHQLSQNVLQLNNGFNTQQNMSFSEIGMLAGVAATDWSWGAIILDMDNDGLKDIFVSNGIFRDVTDQDYLATLMQKENIRQIFQGDKVDFPELIREMPSTKLRNYAFRNTGNFEESDRNLTFSNLAAKWGLDSLSFSNGVAYGDLDNDGDNDLVINNVNQPAFVYRNETDSLMRHHYLKVKLAGTGKNTFAIGAKVTLRCADQKQFVLEQIPMRGFQASVDYVLTFGLGKINNIDTLITDWPDGSRTIKTNIPADQLIVLFQKDSASYTTRHASRFSNSPQPLFRNVTNSFPLKYEHIENKFTDFQREALLPHKLSTEGPKIAKGDVNRDGLEDLYIGGAKESPGKLLIQTKTGGFNSIDEELFQKNKISEDVDAAFFDADRDGDLDLYVVSGGNEYSMQAPAILDRLYINDGNGNFSLSTGVLPQFYASGSCVAPGDFDGDGDLDLFIGSRSVPWQYGINPKSYLLQNDGKGRFTIVTEKYAPELETIGMVTGAEWIDVNNDKKLDLIVVGQWMPVTVFRNNGNRLENITKQAGLEHTNGWWNCIAIDDLNDDGIMDLVTGNWGENLNITASLSEPASLYISDFDRNGLIDPILCSYKQGKNHALPLRPDLVNQLPYLKTKFPRNADYGGKQITEIFTKEELEKAILKTSYLFSTTIFWGNKDGTFRAKSLPAEAQVAPVYAISINDFNNDGKKDILMGGNMFGANPQLGRYDASYGTLLLGTVNGEFKIASMKESGLALDGQVRDIISLKRPNKQEVILIARNSEQVLVYELTGSYAY